MLYVLIVYQNITTTFLRNANLDCCVSSGGLVENSPQACGFGVDVRSVLDPIWEDVDVTLGWVLSPFVWFATVYLHTHMCRYISIYIVRLKCVPIGCLLASDLNVYLLGVCSQCFSRHLLHSAAELRHNR